MEEMAEIEALEVDTIPDTVTGWILMARYGGTLWSAFDFHTDKIELTKKASSYASSWDAFCLVKVELPIAMRLKEEA